MQNNFNLLAPKVFGIGMHRTGTTSLLEAFNHLGIKATAFPTQLLEKIDHPIIHQCQGFTDNPLPLLYRKLDLQYPNSKFILTIRGEEKWLASVEWLFATGAEKFGWRHKPIVDVIHMSLYGTTKFEPQRFLQVYRKHNSDVQNYFRGRKNDLLVMDFEAGNGYLQLCPFLNLEIPEGGVFPYSNRQESIEDFRKSQLILLEQHIAKQKKASHQD